MSNEMQMTGAMDVGDGVPAGDQSILDEARERFAQACEAEQDERKEAADDIRFISGDQWPEDVKRARGNRPCPVNNRLPQFINQVVNEHRRSRPSIVVSPVGGGATVATAKVFQGMIRHIERISRAEVAYDTALHQAVSASFGHFRIKTDYTNEASFDQELMIERIPNQFTVYTDPAYNEPDAIDAGWRFVTSWEDCDSFEAKYGFVPTTIDQAGKGDDVPEWYDEDKVRVAEYWRVLETETEEHMLSDGQVLDGKLTTQAQALMALAGLQVLKTKHGCKRQVEQYLMTADRIIKKSQWLGKYIPIVTIVGSELIVDGKRKKYSLIRFAKDAARMDNFWAATEAELIAMRPKAPFVGAEGSFDGHEAQWKRANSDNLPYLTYKPVEGQPPPMRQPFDGTPTGVREARMAAIEDQKAIMGMHDASLGARSNETSGVAVRERSKQGDTATFHFTDNAAHAIESCGRILVDLIPRVYDSQRTVRIIKPDDQASMVAINQMFIDQETGQPTSHDLAHGQYDVTVKIGPSFQSQREEARAAMLELLQVFPQAAPLVGDLVVSNMDWPGADEIAERLKKMVPPQALGQPAPQPPPNPLMAVEQAKAQQIQMKGQVDIELKRIEAQIQQATLQEKSQNQQIEMQLKALELQLKRQELQMQQVLHQQAMELGVLKLRSAGQPGQPAEAGMGADNWTRLTIAELQEETKRMIAASDVQMRLNTNVPDPSLVPGAPQVLQ